MQSSTANAQAVRELDDPLACVPAADRLWLRLHRDPERRVQSGNLAALSDGLQQPSLDSELALPEPSAS